MSDDVPGMFVRSLRRCATLDAGSVAAVAALPYTRRIVQPSSYIVREGEAPRSFCTFVIAGFAYRQKLSAEGARQIVSLRLSGEFLDLQHLFLDIADHNVQALTLCEVADVSRAALRSLVLDHHAVARAIWIDGLIEASIHREWLLNVGRRGARPRLAHFLCEFTVRMREAGIAGQDCYEFPMTQEQLGDATGLTRVHVNRTLKALVAEGLIQFNRRRLTIIDWRRWQAVGEFNGVYLHLDQTTARVG